MAGVGKRGKHIKWDDDWIVANYWSDPDLRVVCNNYNSSHSTSIGNDVFRHHCKQKLGLTRAYSKRQEEWLFENYPKLGKEKCAELFNEKFLQNRSAEALQSYCKKNGVKCNSITKRLIWKENFGSKSMEVGAIKKHKGYTYIKVADELGNFNKNWKMLHHKVYEDNYGPIPKGHIVIFLDNNKENFSPDNLIAIPRKYNGLLNGNCLKSECAEITKAGIQWCELYELLHQKGEVDESDYHSRSAGSADI